MRQIYKDIVIGSILASFTFSPAAFAKPRGAKAGKTRARNVSKAPLYTNMVKTIKSSKKGLKVSDFVESAEPMVKKREFRDIKKMALPFWDKKFDQLTLGNDYFKMKFKGYTLFARYVDRGPIAFMVNNKPFLWKDFLIYGRAKARLTEIVLGRKAKKVSFIDALIQDVFPKAFAITKKDHCEDIEGAEVLLDDNGAYAGCQCPNDGPKNAANVQPICPAGPPVIVPPEPDCEGELDENGECVVVDPTAPKKKNKWLPWIIGGGLLLLLVLKMMKKKEKTTERKPPDPGWTPEPEGSCKTDQARGLSKKEWDRMDRTCGKSSCETAGTCGDDNGPIY